MLLGAIAMAGCSHGAPVAPRQVSFPTADGGTVFADLYGEGRDALVLAHGAAFNKESWRGFALDLAGRGFLVMAIDFRGYGQSKAGSAGRDGLFEDILAAARHLRERGARRVAALGASMGGSAVAQAAAAARHFLGLVSEQSLYNLAARTVELEVIPVCRAYGLGLAHPERIKGATLLIASEDEPDARRMAAEYERMPDPKQLVLLPGTAHAQHILKTDQAPRVVTSVASFLSPVTARSVPRAPPAP
jgi:pimeloyl-ACP methyl ester carboxylesterase